MTDSTIVNQHETTIWENIFLPFASILSTSKSVVSTSLMYFGASWDLDQFWPMKIALCHRVVLGPKEVELARAMYVKFLFYSCCFATFGSSRRSQHDLHHGKC